MKIKTVWFPIDMEVEFDDVINELLEAGYQLVRRELIRTKSWEESVLYTELVLPDEPEPEPQEAPLSPMGALHVIQDACTATSATDCLYNCPLRPWCNQLRDGGDPTDWDLSRLEADA